jgi:DNA-binding SARP family transcriptional activator
VGLLGPFEVRIGGGPPLHVGGMRQKALLAVLALHANEVVSMDRIVDELWGENAPAGAVHTVQVFVSRLRGALNEAAGQLATRPPGYLLELGADEVDADRCERLYAAARSALAAGDAARAAELLRETEALWRGPPLADFVYEPFAQATIGRLEELRVGCREELVEAELAQGRHADVISDVEALAREQPFRERPRRLLMLALYRCGRQAEALEAFKQARQMLVDELGLEPSPALRELEQSILRQDPALELRSPVAVGAPPLEQDARPVRLPLPWTLERATSGTFVGREAELGRILQWWSSAGNAPKRAVLLSGEPGIGKTRLAAELGRSAHDDGALVLYGRCDEEVAIPYQPIVEALRPYALALGPDGLARQLGARAPELGRLWPALALSAAPVHSDPEWGQAALFDAVRALLEAAARRRRVLLVLDDLHWATGGTVLLLRHLLGPDRPTGVLVVAGYRDSDLQAGSPLGQLVVHLQRSDDATLVSLAGLEESAIAALVADAADHVTAESAARMAHRLRTHTSGNPFFISELLAHLAESGALSSQAPDGERRLDVPERLRAVILERVARLSALSRTSLSVAAVAGMRFPLPVVERLVGESGGVLDALDEAVAAGIVADAGHGEYAFVHALVRQALYEALASARRMLLHRDIGEVLEQLPSASGKPDELAGHFAEAAAYGQADKAATYALAAGREAAARLGYEEAAAQYRRGLESLRFTTTERADVRAQLLLGLGDALWRIGEVDGAERACLEASALAGELGDPELLARAALGLAGPFLLEMSEQGIEPAVKLLSQALASLGTEETALRASVMARLAACVAYGPTETRRPDLARDALEIMRRVGDREGLALVLAMYHHVILEPDQARECLAAALELAGVAAAIGDRQLELEAREWAVDHLLELGLADAAQRELKGLCDLAERLDDRFSKWLLAVSLARDAHLKGRLGEFEALAFQGLELGFESRHRSATQIFGGQMIALRREQARLGEVLDAAEALTAQFPDIPVWRCTLAYIYAELDREASARREVDAVAARAFTDIPRDGFWLSSLATLCEAVAFLDDATRAAQLYELLRPYANRNVVIFGVLCLGSVSRHLGLLAMTMSRYEDALRHFDDALRMHSELGSALWTAHAKYNQARLLLRRHSPGDHDQAIVLLDEVLAASKSHGFGSLETRARGLSGERADEQGQNPAVAPLG